MVYIREHLFNIGERTAKKHRSKVVGLFGSYIDLFPHCIDAFDICNQYIYPINTTDPNPIFCRSYLTAKQNQQLKEKIDQLKFTGHLKESQSEWSSPVYPYVNDGQLELFVDFNDLNAITIDYPYNINQADKIVDYIVAKKPSLFTKLVVREPFSQLKISDCNAHRTAIATDFGVYQFSTLYDGLKNANNCLQMTMEKVLSDSCLTADEKNFISIYLGEILIFNSTYEQHFSLVKGILKSLRQSNLKLDSNKCFMFMDEIHFLDHILDANGAKLDQNKLTKILKHPPPKNKCELKLFLDLIRHFKVYYDENIARPLYNNLTNPVFQWKESEKLAFNCLKNQLALNCPL